MGEEVAQAEDRGFKGAPHMGFLSKDKVSPSLPNLSEDVDMLHKPVHVDICILFKLQNSSRFLWCSSVSLVRARQDCEHP